MANRYGIKNLSSLPARPIFFDANILLYIFWPIGSLSWSDKYSTIFKSLLEQKKIMAFDITVASEVINRSIRFEYEKYLTEKGLKKELLPFKQYRESKDGKEVQKEIFTILKKKILPLFGILGKAFDKSDLDRFLIDDPMDFSDKMILSICKENNCILLTNDKDFANSDIDILSSNPAVLR
jgi:predicted nucleic acid-binding protein